MMGFRDCAQEAVRFLTDRAGLDPDSAVVQGVRGLLGGPTNATRVPRVATSSAADVDVSSDAGSFRRSRRTTRSVEEEENRSLTARRCLHGRISRRQSHRGRSRCQHAPTAVVGRPSASQSLYDCHAVTNLVGQSTTAVSNDDRRNYPLRTLQTTQASSNSPSATTAGVQDVDVTTICDVAECASVLVRLAQSDDRVRNVLTELLQLMDAQ